MDFYENIWNNRTIKEDEIDKNKYFIMLNRNNKEFNELKTYLKDSKVVDKYMDEVTKINEDPEFREYMSYEKDQEMIFNSLLIEETEKARKIAMDEGRAEGRAEGWAEGMDQEKTKIASNMLANNINDDLIIKITGISKKQLLELKTKKSYSK